MDRKQKNQMKSIISEFIDLGNGRYKDDEVDQLHDLVNNIDDYADTSRTYKNSFTDWSSDGKYRRDEETTYTLRNNNDRITIEEDYRYQDDDGQSGGFQRTYETGREILNLFGKIFKD